MALTIGTNSASLAAARSLHESSREMQTAMERLSTGKKVNSASDDAAGLAIAESMSGLSRSLDQASKNINNGLALTTAMEAGLDEATDMLVRMRELSVQAANDTYSAAERKIMNAEMVALRNELTALSTRQSFGDLSILDGSLSGKVIQVGDGASETIALVASSIAAGSVGAFTSTGDLLAASTHEDSVDDAADAIRSATEFFNITPSGGTATTTNYGTDRTESANQVAAAVNLETSTHGVVATAVTKALLQIENTTASTSISLGNTDSALTAITATTSRDTLIQNINAVAATTGITASAHSTALGIILTDVDGHDIGVKNKLTATGGNHVLITQFSAGSASGSADTVDNEADGSEFGVVAGQVTLTSNETYTITESGTTAYVSAGTASSSLVSTASLTTQANANIAIGTFDGAIAQVAKMKADIGAVSNRLNHALDSNIVLRDMTEQAVSTLIDADYSAESAKLARAQVQQQVGTAMLAQAKASQQLVLQLLQ